ncbi:MAG TPA: hemolysin family protein [Acidimicrobiales bacterium]|nr:hemolysin family protein [Acidimicrobiales bacterium]
MLAASRLPGGPTHHFSGVDSALIVAVVILIIFSALFALSETALTRMSKVKAIALVESRRRGAASLLKLVAHPERNLPVVLFALQICTLVAATMVGVVADRVFGPWGVVIATVFEIVVIFVFAELAPKIWAVQHSERAALFMAPFLVGLVSFPPLRWSTHALIAVANLILPGKGLKEGPYVTEGELLAMADTAAEEEVIEREERKLIHSIIDFGDTVAREVMVPRPDMVTIAATAAAHEAADVASGAGFSRIPVYGQGIDDIVGIAYVKDLMRAEREGHADDPVTQVMRQAQFVPDSKRVAEVMREMQAGKNHMAIVVDEYGGTAGLITLEDVLEELVGEISDEYDVDRPRVEYLDGGQLKVDASLSIDEVNELTGFDLPEGDWDTVGGLLYNLLGHVPVEGESAVLDGHVITAQKVIGRRIANVVIAPRQPSAAAEADSGEAGGHAERGAQAPGGGTSVAEGSGS